MAQSSGRFMAKAEIDCETLRQIVDYDDDARGLVWRKTWGKRVRGEKIGTPTSRKGYLAVAFSGRRYSVHRLVWLYVYGYLPNGFIDHIDGDPSNNRVSNLREVSQCQNLANSGLNSRNTSGHKGVCFSKKTGLWRAYVTKEYKTHWLGYYPTKEAAFAARVAAADRLHGEFARHI